jgi:hypothetical protein
MSRLASSTIKRVGVGVVLICLVFAACGAFAVSQLGYAWPYPHVLPDTISFHGATYFSGAAALAACRASVSSARVSSEARLRDQHPGSRDRPPRPRRQLDGSCPHVRVQSVPDWARHAKPV